MALGILSTKPIIRKGFCWRMGMGDSVDYWKDPWIPQIHSFLPQLRSLNCLEMCGMVFSFVDNEGKWNDVTLRNLFDNNTVINAKKIFWSEKDSEDTTIWLPSCSGHFSVKSASAIINPCNEDANKWWKFLWASKIHERLKFFMWKLSNECLPNLVWLKICNVITFSVACLHGCHTNESLCHLFFSCHMDKAFWFAFSWCIRWE